MRRTIYTFFKIKIYIFAKSTNAAQDGRVNQKKKIGEVRTRLLSKLNIAFVANKKVKS
jgi:hypothetical protein